MTNEEAKKILAGYVKACNEDDFPTLEMFEYEKVIEAMTMGAKALSIPSLPSNLDEVAEKSAKAWRRNEDGSESKELFPQPFVRGFKAGAEWMAGQFHKIDGDLVD